MWQKPITDRTLGDIESVRERQRDTSIMYKGCLNMEDINRIINNSQMLANFLKIHVAPVYIYDFILTQTILDTLLQNVKQLVDTCNNKFSTNVSLNITNLTLDYTEFNLLEQALLDVYRLTLYQDTLRPHTTEIYTNELGD